MSDIETLVSALYDAAFKLEHGTHDGVDVRIYDEDAEKMANAITQAAEFIRLARAESADSGQRAVADEDVYHQMVDDICDSVQALSNAIGRGELGGDGTEGSIICEWLEDFTDFADKSGIRWDDEAGEYTLPRPAPNVGAGDAKDVCQCPLPIAPIGGGPNCYRCDKLRPSQRASAAVQPAAQQGEEFDYLSLRLDLINMKERLGDEIDRMRCQLAANVISCLCDRLRTPAVTESAKADEVVVKREDLREAINALHKECYLGNTLRALEAALSPAATKD